MFVFLSKFLPPLVYPLGLVILLIVAALLLGQRPQYQRLALALALGLLLLSSNRLAAAALVRGLEYRHLPPPEIAQAPAAGRSEPLAPVIVLLGGGTDSFSPPRPMVELNGAGDRVLYAAQLYRLGYAPRLLVTGGNINWMTNGRSPAEDMRDLLIFLGVPVEAIWLESESQNTYENALYTRQLLAADGIDRIILVTSAQHMPRSVGLFVKQGFEVLPAPADFTLTEEEWQRLVHPQFVDIIFNLLPGAGHLATFTSALKEYLGIFVYWLRGWL